MEMTAEQKQTVADWLEQGANLAEIQQRLGNEFDIRLTYMEARFLIDDLKLSFKEPAVPEPVAVAADAEAIPAEFDAAEPGNAFAPEATNGGGVSLSVDAITRPSALVSGSVTFSDGKKAAWYLDQTGRLGMVPGEQGYRPPEPDIAEFQRALEKELVKLGM